MLHQPMIQMVPTPYTKLASFLTPDRWKSYTHVLFTSQTAVSIWYEYFWEKKGKILDHFPTFIAIGPATKKALQQRGLEAKIPKIATQEGVIRELSFQKWEEKSCLFWPRSFYARDKIAKFCKKRSLSLVDPVFYHLRYRPFTEKIDWSQVEGLIFTSPSTVIGFKKQKVFLSPPIRIFAKGEITKKALQKHIPSCKKIENLDKLLI